MNWCYGCRTMNKHTLILHQSGCPPELIAWEEEE